jgi:hypothetical protein
MFLPLGGSTSTENAHFPGLRYLIPEAVALQILLDDFFTVIVTLELLGALTSR